MDCSAELIAQVDSLFIEAELRERDLLSFSKRNMNEGGNRVTADTEGVMFLKNHGLECRIYFNADDFVVSQLAMLGYVPTVDKRDDPVKRGTWRGEYRYRIDSNAFYFLLVRNGFHLGAWPRPLAAAA